MDIPNINSSGPKHFVTFLIAGVLTFIVITLASWMILGYQLKNKPNEIRNRKEKLLPRVTEDITRYTNQDQWTTYVNNDLRLEFMYPKDFSLQWRSNYNLLNFPPYVSGTGVYLPPIIITYYCGNERLPASLKFEEGKILAGQPAKSIFTDGAVNTHIQALDKNCVLSFLFQPDPDKIFDYSSVYYSIVKSLKFF